jgi:hypothetical protein
MMKPPPTGTSAVLTLGPLGAAALDEAAVALGDAGAEELAEGVGDDEAAEEEAGAGSAGTAGVAASEEHAPNAAAPPPARATRPAVRSRVRRLAPGCASCAVPAGSGVRFPTASAVLDVSASVGRESSVLDKVCSGSWVVDDGYWTIQASQAVHSL